MPFELNGNLEFFGQKDMIPLFNKKKKEKEKSIKGYPFKLVTTDNKNYGLKVIPLEDIYESDSHPVILEPLILKEVSSTGYPHYTKYIQHFTLTVKAPAIKSLNLVKMEKQRYIKRKCMILVSEFADYGTLNDWVYDMYKAKKEITLREWKILTFQLIHSIYNMQTKWKMMHNDFHYGNILMFKSTSPKEFKYNVGKLDFKMENTGVIPKLWDFEFANMYRPVKGMYYNQYLSDVDNVPGEYDDFYDLHYLLISLLELYIPKELFKWIVSKYPEEVIPEDESDSSEDESSDSDSTSSSSESSDLTRSSASNSGTSDSDSESESDSTASSESVEPETDYLKDTRLKNGVYKNFKLPTPLQLLTDSFFDEFRVQV